jgi:hypothetical protein
MTKDEALKLALEALENIDRWLPTIGQKGLRDYEADAITAIKEALAQPEPFKPDWDTQAVLVEDAIQRMTKELKESSEKIKKLEKVIEDFEIEREQDNAYIYASSLATAIWQKHYIKESPKFELLDTTEGVLTQIDNMTCGLVREKPAQQEQEPVAWGVFDHNLHDMFFAKEEAQEMVRLKGDGSTVKPLYTTPPQRTWVGLTHEEVFAISNTMPYGNRFEFAIAIEARLKEKNT